MKVLLTGATGFLGSEIARQLVAAGHDVRVTVRAKSPLEGLAGLPIEKVEADILDKAAIARALDGCDAVIHTAASVSFRLRDRDSIFRTNVEGTRTVLTAALEKGVRRAIYTSSVAAIGAAEEPRLLDESTAWDLEPLGCHYITAKKRAEEVAFEIAKQGLPLVVLNPGTILGPCDPHLSSSRILLELVNGRMPIYFEGGTSFCDVRDVAAAHVAALERGRPGERYILAGQNVSLGETFEIASRIAGIRKPVRVPYAVAWLGAVFSELAARLVGHSLEEFNRPMIRMSARFGYMDVRKAAKELGYAVRPIEESIRDTIADHVRRGLVRVETPELGALKERPAAAATLAPAAA